MPPFRKIVIFGVGLIGGSFALALRKAHAVGELVGFGRSAATLEQARHLGIIDRIGKSEAQEVGDADMVLLAVPVGQMADIMRRIAPHLGADTLLTDAGSTKANVIAAARENLGAALDRFVPAHPIAGAEKSGAAAAQADLYQHRKVVLTPLRENAPSSVARVRAAWELCGATVSELEAEQHDHVFASVSHLPHLLSFALVHGIARQSERDLLLSFAASGFRDFTRIAGSSPEMWRDICMANRVALLQALDAYRAELDELRVALNTSDAARLEAIFAVARDVRQDWQADKTGSQS